MPARNFSAAIGLFFYAGQKVTTATDIINKK
ncbi:hypothetical protein HDC33_001034 [Sporosarcina sp. JAI121]|nr:hypothetical protein [Sporosarcina sp. JAI121]